MSYQLIIEHSPVHELINSLYAYIHGKQLKHAHLGSDWRQSVSRQLTTKFAAELSDERWEVLHRINLLVGLCPEKSSVPRFIDWLRNQSPGEIYERLSPWVDLIPANLHEIRDRSVYLLTEWHEQYFCHWGNEQLSVLQADAAYQRSLLETLEPIDLIEDATNGIRIEPVEELQTVYLIPQFHCHPYVILDFYQSVCTCMYPSPLLDSQLNQPPWGLLDTAQALADENRLHILRYIAQQPCSFSDIQQQIGLAKSTTNHHIAMLRRAGLIRAHHYGSSTAQKYSIREKGFANMLHSVRGFVNLPQTLEGVGR